MFLIVGNMKHNCFYDGFHKTGQSKFVQIFHADNLNKYARRKFCACRKFHWNLGRQARFKRASGFYIS